MNWISQSGSTSGGIRLSVTSSALTLLTFLLTLMPNLVYAQIPTPSLVYAFTGTTSDIDQAQGALAQGRDGNLYGAGRYRGANGQGGVFKVTPSGTLTLIASFPSTWQACYGVVMGLDGNFYGTCQVGGAHNWGFVYKVTPAGVLTDIYDFTGTANDGAPSQIPVLGANGDLYGTTGSVFAAGNIYRLTTAGSYLNIKSGNSFSNPSTLSAGSDGNFYGTWAQTPTAGNQGAVFKVSAAGTYSEIFDFSGTTASVYPSTGVILASNGKLYGNDGGRGANGNGAIYSLKGSTLTDLFDINSINDGALNLNNPLQASDGNFYGASQGGGSGNQGSFYELTSANAFSVYLIVNNALYGDQPLTPLMQHTNGTIYGTTSTNGPNGYGAVMSFNIGASPFISLVSPVAAGAEGSTVQILGQGFKSSSVVKFGGTAATKVQVTGSTFIQAMVPASALTGKITVTTGSTTLSTNVTFRVVPKVISFSPPSGSVGTAVTITGTGFTQTTGVKFNGTAATFTVNSDTQITATVPTGATSGKITVTTKGGSASSSTSFTVN